MFCHSDWPLLAGPVHVRVRDEQACRDRQGALRGERGGRCRLQRLTVTNKHCCRKKRQQWQFCEGARKA